MKLFSTLFLFASSFILLGCEKSPYEQCRDDASQYWDAKATGNTKADNPKYWAAIEKCNALNK